MPFKNLIIGNNIGTTCCREGASFLIIGIFTKKVNSLCIIPTYLNSDQDVTHVILIFIDNKIPMLCLPSFVLREIATAN